MCSNFVARGQAAGGFGQHLWPNSYVIFQCNKYNAQILVLNFIDVLADAATRRVPNANALYL